MIKTTFTKLKLIPYEAEELGELSEDELENIKQFNYKIIEEPILSQEFANVDDIKQKIVEICNSHKPNPIIATMQNYPSVNSFIVGKKYKHADPDALFECIVCRQENNHTTELFRMIGKRLSSRILSYYLKLLNFTQKPYLITNILYDEDTFRYDAIYDTDKLKLIIIKCDTALKNDPNDYHALLQKGWALSELGRYNDAILCYEKILKDVPDHSTARAFKEAALKARENP